MNRLTGIACAVVLLAMAAGCASEGRRVPVDVEAVPTQDFNPTDLQIIGRKAVDDLLAKDVFPAGLQPRLYVAEIRNLTSEHVNVAAIRGYITVRTGDSGRVQLVERKQAHDEALRELEFQRSPFADPATAKELGRMIGADYFLQGELTSIESKAGRKKSQYFQFVLTLVKVDTLESWSSLVNVQKVAKRGFLGW